MNTSKKNHLDGDHSAFGIFWIARKLADLEQVVIAHSVDDLRVFWVDELDRVLSRCFSKI